MDRSFDYYNISNNTGNADYHEIFFILINLLSSFINLTINWG